MPGDKNPQGGSHVNRPRTEDVERRMRAREMRHERPEHYMLREALGHDDLPRDTPEISNLAHIQPYTTGHCPVRDHRKEPLRRERDTLAHTDDDDN